MTDDDFLARLISDNEQDRAACRAWWADATEEERLLVVACIQKPYGDPVMEIMSRFAQLGLCEMVERLAREEAGE